MLGMEDTSERPVEGNNRPVQCELHEEVRDRNRYVCNLTWPFLASLRMDRFPKDLVLHLQTGAAWDSGEIDSRLASISIDDLEVSADQIRYHSTQDDPREWLDFLWQSLSLAGLIDRPVDFEWEDRFGFVSFPTAEEYAGRLVQCARKFGFTVTNRSDTGVDVFMEKELTAKDGSLFDCVVDEFKPVNREMIAFLAERTVLRDYATEERVRFVRELGLGGTDKGDGSEGGFRSLSV
jgi:hypothetical protein